MSEKLRVCVISPTMNVFGGGHMSLLTLLEYLVKKDVEIKLIMPQEGEMDDIFEGKGIECKIIPFERWVLSPWEEGEHLKLKTTRIFDSTLEIIKTIRNWKSDIIYTNTSVVNVGAIAATLLNLPHVWHIRESLKHHNAHKTMLSFESTAQFMDSTTNHFFFISQPLAEDYKDFISGDKYEVVYNYLSKPRNELKEVSESIKYDIVVPYYNDEDTIKCLDSVKTNKGKYLNKVIVVGDCGPDEEMNQRVEEYCKENSDIFEYSQTDKNGGYVYACNWGMSISKNDVIILTTDTIVTKGWSDTMRVIAYQEEEIGTVTPLSNSANIFSIPDSKFNEDDDPEYTNQILNKISAHDYIDVFTMHGFCSYIKRELIDKIGMYDYEKYTYGYGEENDYSMRATDAGYRAVIATKAYVKHIGGQSFGTERKKKLMEQNKKIRDKDYPNYKDLWREFMDQDELHEIRTIVRHIKPNKDILNGHKGLIVGTIEENKGQIDAVKAVKVLLDKGVKFHLFLVGRTTVERVYYEKLMDFVEENGLSSYVHYLGPLKNEYVFKMMEFVDIYLMCSRSEAFGRVTAEAMLAGKPVIGSNAGGTKELVKDGERGFLYEPGDFNDLASSIEKLISNKSSLEKMGANAQEYINEMMNLEKYAGTIHSKFLEIKRQKDNELALSHFLSPWMLNKYVDRSMALLILDHIKMKSRDTIIYKSIKTIKDSIKK